MYRYALLTLLLTGALATSAARADDVTTYGAGLNSCQDYLEARGGNPGNEVPYVDWLSGYFSAVNRTSAHRNNIFGLADLGYALERLDDQCRTRPGVRFAEATSLLVFGAKPGPAAHALDATSYGTADKGCRVFVEAREQQEAAYWAEFLNWLGGYLSGVNAASLRTNSVLGDTQLIEVLHWLDAYCSEHPVTPFSGAVDELIAARQALVAERHSTR